MVPVVRARARTLWRRCPIPFVSPQQRAQASKGRSGGRTDTAPASQVSSAGKGRAAVRPACARRDTRRRKKHPEADTERAVGAADGLLGAPTTSRAAPSIGPPCRAVRRRRRRSRPPDARRRRQDAPRYGHAPKGGPASRGEGRANRDGGAASVLDRVVRYESADVPARALLPGRQSSVRPEHRPPERGGGRCTSTVCWRSRHIYVL